MPRTKDIIEQDIIELRQRLDELEQEAETAAPRELSIHSGGAKEARADVGTIKFTADSGGVDIVADRENQHITGYWGWDAARQLRDYLNAHFPVDA